MYRGPVTVSDQIRVQYPVRKTNRLAEPENETGTDRAGAVSPPDPA